MGSPLLEEALDLVRADGGGADGLDAKLGVEVGARRVVDPADHLLDTELVLSQLIGHDVRGIGIGHRHERLRAVRPGPTQVVLLAPRPEDRYAVKTLAL